jgi:hypothetical protein
VAVDAGVAQRGILVAPEGEHGLVHLLGVEHLEPHQQVEILHCQSGDGEEQVRFQPGDDILQRVLAKVGQVHEGRDAGGELDQLLLNQLALGLVFPFLGGELTPLLRRQVLLLGLALEYLDQVLIHFIETTFLASNALEIDP